MALRILIPIDGSPCALNAVRHALALAALGGGVELTLLNVQLPLATGHVRQFIGRETLEAHYREAGDAVLREAVALVEEAGHSCVTHIAVGRIAATIAGYAAELESDLVVMGSHGRRGVSHALLGSVAQEVIRATPKPVTIVK
ncbi:MAG: universal stress protein [Pseudomonadales bacterium]|jgi:nucleotide-binding universal stress UspA family protein